jgi:eukaryotic-like serine/threonine-protein kinase
MIGETISHYTILSKLGEGGMGVVYKAHDTRLDRLVALKFMPPHITPDESEKARFLQEAKAASALNHPNVCTIYGIHDEDGREFIEMEFVDGGTLRHKLPVQSLAEAVGYAIQIGDALNEAHQKGIVHRDIKAENIMINAKNQVKVMDFGLAKLKGSLKLTKAMSTVGTLAYMAPEQIQGGEVDARSDIFSFGVVLYELLSGHVPFRGEHEAAVMYSILNEEPVPLEQDRRDIPPVLSNLIQRCLEKDPADRYQTAGDIVIELRRVQKLSARVVRSGVVPAYPAQPAATSSGRQETATLPPPPARIPGWKKFLWPAAGIMVAVAALLVYKYFQNPPQSQQFQQMKITRMTNSGKVSQAAVSPDGRYLVYAQDDVGKQSLWVRQTATMSNVQIVPASEAQYGKIVFSRDGNFVYLLKADKNGALSHLYSIPVLGGPMRKLVHNVDSFTLSPDGSHIAFVRYTIGDATFDLIISDADGTNERNIGQRKAPQSYGSLAWAPDGATIACSFVDGNKVSVVSVPVTGGAGRVMSTYDWSAISSMEWMADGSGLVVVPQNAFSTAGAQIWQIAYPSGEIRRITNDLNNYISISVTADSKALVTTETEFHSAVWKLPASDAGHAGWNSDQARQVTFGKDDGAMGVSQTPDGRIVYAASAGGASQIWIMEPGGNDPRQLTSGDIPAVSPTVSPDGKYIVFLRNTNSSVDLWRVNSDGTNLLQLTNGAFAFTPACTPDSKWVVYSHVKDGKYDVWKIPIDGGTPVQITNRHSHTVAVSPDGKSIVCEYQENETGTSHVVAIVSLENGKPAKTFERQEYSDFGWLPDAAALAVVEYHDGIPNLWTIPLDGSQGEQLTHLKTDRIFTYSISHDGKSLVVAHGPVVSDVIMISNFH